MELLNREKRDWNHLYNYKLPQAKPKVALMVYYDDQKKFRRPFKSLHSNLILQIVENGTSKIVNFEKLISKSKIFCQV